MGTPKKDWLRQLNKTFWSLLLGTVGVYLGGCIWSWMDYKLRPELYAMQSAPWYIVQLVPRTATLLLVLAAGGLLYLALRRWLGSR